MTQPTMEMSKEEIEAACLKGDLSRQWEWHSSFRDAAKNMYRTNTFDGVHMRETCVLLLILYEFFLLSFFH